MSATVTRTDAYYRDLAYQPRGGAPKKGYRLDVKPSPFDPRDYLDTASRSAVAKLPTLHMIRQRPPHKQQGRQGSCTGNQFARTYEQMEMIAGRPYEAKSAACIYILERDLEGDPSEDAGAYPIDGCRVLLHKGVCLESLMPYDDRVFDRQPSAAALTDAATRKIAAYYRPLTLHAALLQIAKDIPVALAIDVYRGMEDSTNGVVPMPSQGESALGGHSIAADGYCFRPDWPGGGYLRLPNTWGEDAGDHGDYYLPFAYAGDARLCFEFRRISLSQAA
jgi:hypothetical protein